jgi:DNA gyrase subunit A
MQTIEEDIIEELFMTTTHHYIMFFTNKGRVYRIKAYEIPEASRTARGMAIINLLQLMPEEYVTAVIPLRAYVDDKYLLMCTKTGMVKKTKLTEYANVRKIGLTAINLKENDELIEVKMTDNTKDIFLVTKKGMCIRFHETDVRCTGRASMGVIGMKLDDDDEIVGMQHSTQGEALLLVSEYGLGKRTKLSEFKCQNRGGKGLKCYKITEKSGNIVGFKAVNEDNEIMLITNQGIVIRTGCDEISMLGRNTTGVKLINIDAENGVRVASISKVRQKSAEESETLVNEDADDEVDGYEEDADNLDVIGGDDGVVEGDGVSDKKGDE